MGSEDGNGYQACYGRQVLCTNSSKLKMSFTYIALYDPTNYEAMIRVLRDMNPAAIEELRVSTIGQGCPINAFGILNKSLSAPKIHGASEHTGQSHTTLHSKLQMMVKHTTLGALDHFVETESSILMDLIKRSVMMVMMIPQTAAPTSAS